MFLECFLDEDEHEDKDKTSTRKTTTSCMESPKFGMFLCLIHFLNHPKVKAWHHERILMNISNIIRQKTKISKHMWCDWKEEKQEPDKSIMVDLYNTLEKRKSVLLTLDPDRKRTNLSMKLIFKWILLNKTLTHHPLTKILLITFDRNKIIAKFANIDMEMYKVGFYQTDFKKVIYSLKNKSKNKS